MLPRSIPNIALDSFCKLVGDKSNGAEEIEKFITMLAFTEARGQDKDAVMPATASIYDSNGNLKFPIDAPNSEGLRAIEAAAASGSVSSLAWLLNIKEVRITADDKKRNLLDFACPDNDETTAYILDQNERLWDLFKDGTTALMVHVAAGRIADVKRILEKNIDRLCDFNLRHQNLFYWAKKTENKAMLDMLKDFGKRYLKYYKKDQAKQAKYHFCLGHYQYHFDHPDNAIASFEKCIELLNRVIPKNHRSDLMALNILQCVSLQFSARLHDRVAHSIHRKFQRDVFKKSVDYYLQANNQLVKVKNYLQDYPHLCDAILMETAEALYSAANRFFSTGESCRMQGKYQQALEAFEPAVQYCDTIVRLLEIRDKPINNAAYLEKFYDMDKMAKGHAGICRKMLAGSTATIQILQSTQNNLHVDTTDQALQPDETQLLSSKNGVVAAFPKKDQRPGIFSPNVTPVQLHRSDENQVPTIQCTG